jgi:hypothetical protein
LKFCLQARRRALLQQPVVGKRLGFRIWLEKISPRLCWGFFHSVMPRQKTPGRAGGCQAAKLQSVRIFPMPRFVLLYHDCPPTYVRASHWDLMLESAGVLRTWVLAQLPRDWQAARTRTAAAFPNCPLISPENTVVAVQLSDHRLDYLGFEGLLSGDRGTVIRVATGIYRSEHEGACDWQLVLTSDGLAAAVRLSRFEADNEHWMLSYEDEASSY